VPQNLAYEQKDTRFETYLLKISRVYGTFFSFIIGGEENWCLALCPSKKHQSPQRRGTNSITCQENISPTAVENRDSVDPIFRFQWYKVHQEILPEGKQSINTSTKIFCNVYD
jgi:hypothetical protein